MSMKRLSFPNFNYRQQNQQNHQTQLILLLTLLNTAGQFFFLDEKEIRQLRCIHVLLSSNLANVYKSPIAYYEICTIFVDCCDNKQAY